MGLVFAFAGNVLQKTRESKRGWESGLTDPIEERRQAARRRERERKQDAKRRRKRGKKGKGEGSGKDRCLRPGDACNSDSQCCSTTTRSICAVSSYASNSDKTCCGGVGAVCGPQNEDGDYLPPHCCAGYECFYNTGSSTGVCQKLPDDI